MIEEIILNDDEKIPKTITLPLCIDCKAIVDNGMCSSGCPWDGTKERTTIIEATYRLEIARKLEAVPQCL